MKHTTKRLTAIFLTLCMLLSVLPLGAFATSAPESYVFDISEGNVTVVDGDTAGKIKVEYGGGSATEEFDPSQVITVTGTVSGGSLTIDTATAVTIKASNLTINNGYNDYMSPMYLRNDAANVTLVLEGENLFVGGRDQAGIVVETGRTLTITGTGSLEARAEDHNLGYTPSCGAGIGGRVNESCGTVIIESGTVTAIGGTYAAGIGGGGKYGAGSTTGNGGNVTIYGGTVTATGNGGAADIGGGKDTVDTGALTVDGDAWVTAANIGGTKTLTRGVVNGTLYGDITLTEDLTVDNLTIAVGATLTVPDGVTLTIDDALVNTGTLSINGPEGVNLTANGKLYNSGTLFVNGPECIVGTGTLTGNLAKSRVPFISVNEDLVETGEELDPHATVTAFSTLGRPVQIYNGGGKYGLTPNGWGEPTYSPALVKDAGEYTVSFTLEDVTVSKTFTVDCELDFVEGEMGDTKRVTYNTVLGEVPASEKEGYTFDGWFTEGGEEYDPTAPVIHSATYNARYTPIVYEVTYGDETMDVTFGEPFTVPEATGIGENQTFYAWFGNDGNIYLPDATYTYTIAGDLELNPLVDTDTTYWTVNFIGEDGYLYRTELVEQTENAEVGIPVYAPDPAAAWVCRGVEYEAATTVPVDGDMTFTVKVAELHTVRFMADGVLVSEQQVRHGDMVQYVPAVPEKDGYDGEWSVDLDVFGAFITGDMTVTAKYTGKQYTISYYGAGFSGVPATQTVTYGKTFFVQPYTGSVPDGMTFFGWVSKQGDMFLQTTTSIYDYAGNLSLAPLFDKNTKYWTVKFVGEDDVLADVVLVEQKSDATLTLPVYAEYPDATWTRDNADGIVEYNAGSEVPITGDTTFKVNAPAKYTVTFMANGYQVAQYTVRDGETLPEIPAVPGKTGYSGKWDADLTAPVTGDLTVTAAYTAILRSIPYRMNEHDTTDLASQQVWFDGYFQPLPYTWDVPDGQSFLGWRGTDGNFYIPNTTYRMTCDYTLIMTPVFEDNTEYWTVKFIGESGYLYDVALVEKTSDATVAMPTYAPYADATWTLGDDEYEAGDEVDITGDTTFTVKAPALYTVTFMANGYLVAQYTVRDGETLPEVPAVPEKYGYTGAWDADTDAAITEDTVIEAAYTANEYTIYYYNENWEVYYEEDVTFGDWFTPVAFEGTVPDGMKFLGWNGDDGQFFLAGEYQRLSVASDLYLLPVFAADTEYWTVKFCHPDGSLENVYLVEQAAEAGAEFFMDDKEYSLYPDAQWELTSGDVDEVEVGELVSTSYITVRSDVVFTAVVPDTYTILFRSEEGYLIDARFIMDNELIGAGPEAPAKEGYTFVGWQDENGDLLDDTTVATQDMTYRPVYEAVKYPITLIPSAHVSLNVLPESAEASVGEVITIGTFALVGFETWYVCVYYQNGAGEMVPVPITELPDNDPYDVPDTNGYTFVMPAGPVTVQVVEQANRNTAKFLVDDAVYAFEYILSGEIPTAPTQPVKEGYTFLGWKAQSTGTEYPAGAEFDPIYADETYEAVFEINTYDLTYYRGEEADASEYKCILTLPDGTFVEFFNNDTLNMPTYVVADVTYGETVTLGEPMLPGYVFKGWLDESGYMHPAGAKYAMPADDVLLTAVWEEDQELSCLVRFVNDGKLYDAYLAYDGQDASIPATDPVCEGKTFVGWKYGENTYSNTGVKDFVVIASDARDMTFEAVWEDISYTVTYTDYETVTDIAYGTELVTLEAPEQEGYTFVAWQCAQNGAYYFANTAFTVKSDMTFTAVWAKDNVEYTVKFFDENGNLVDLFIEQEGTELTAPDYEQGRDDAEYVWVDAENNTYLYEGDSFTVEADQNYRATLIDEAQYDVHIFVESDDGALDNVAIANKNTYFLGETAYVAITVPEGYVLKAVSAAGVSNELLPIKDSLLPMGDENYLYIFEMPASDVAVLVELEKIPAGKAYVKFLYDEGGELYDAEIATKGESVNAPELAPTKAGKTFTGWKRGNVVLQPGQEYLISETDDDTIVFVAQWTDDTYMVSFDPDGGTPAPAPVSGVLYAAEITLPDAPAKTGYTFIGWEDAATGFVYKDGASYTVTADAQFTAKWATDAYVVRFVNDDGHIYGYETVEFNQTVTAPAAPTAEGKTFLYWQNGTVQVAAGAETPAVTDNVIYTAVWQTNRHNVTSESVNATVDPATRSNVEVGTEISFTVTPAEDYAVEMVYTTHNQGAAIITTVLTPAADGTYSFTMPDSDVVLHVLTAQNVFSVFQNTDEAPHLSITTADVKASAGADVAFTISSSSEDYALNNVYVKTLSGLYVPVEMKLVAGEPEYHFTMPAEDVMIYAQEAQNAYTVTYVDADNTLLKIETVASGEEAPYFAPDAPAGYTFAGWDNLATTDYVETMPAGDAHMPYVRENLYLKAVYQADTFSVQAGLSDHLERFGATTHENLAGNLVDLLNGGVLNAETDAQVQFAVMAEYDWSITGVAIVTESGKAIQPALMNMGTTPDGDGNECEFRVYAFTMPAENVYIDVYTAAKDYKVTVTENLPEGGEYTINGYVTDNLMVAQGDEARVTVTPADGYVVKNITATYELPNGTIANIVDQDPDINSFAFAMVSYDVTVAIEYEANVYGIDVETGNGATFYPGISSANVDVVIETLSEENQGYVALVGGSFAYDDVHGFLHSNPQNGEGAVGDEIAFTVKTFRGYGLKDVSVTYADGTKSCIVTEKDGVYHFTMPAADVAITASFEKLAYTVNKTVSGEEHGTILMNGKIENEITALYKDEVTVEVTPDAGYYVSSISYEILDAEATDFNGAARYENTAAMVDVLDGTQSLSFNVPSSDVTVTVEYAEIDYTISTQIEGEGSLTVQDKANVGDQVSVIATPSYGYKLVSIQAVDADGRRLSLFTGNTQAETGAEYFFTMPASAVTVSAVFEKVQYVVTYVNYNNAVVGMQGVDYLDTADVDSFVDNVVDGPVGQHFVGWTSADTQNPVTAPSTVNDDFVIVKDTIIKANFAKDEIYVVFEATDNGTVTSEGNNAPWTDESKVYGDLVTFTATPDVGYEIDTITVYTEADKDGDYKEIKWFESAGEYRFRIPATWKDSIHQIRAEDVKVSVTFRKASYTLSKDAACETEGVISVNGKVATETSYTYAYQDEVTISATPKAGWYVKEIRATADDGTVFTTDVKDAPTMDTPVGETETLSFLMPACNVTYTVDYEKIDYSITTVFDADKGDVVTEPADKAQLDDVVKITVTPKLGYALDSLTVTFADGTKSCVLTGVGENQFTFTMPAAAVVVTAEFTEVAYNVALTQQGEGESWMNGYYTVSMNADYLDVVTVTVHPADGWKLTAIVVDGGNITVNEEIKAEGGDYSFTMPNRDVTVEVILEKIEYVLQSHTINFFEDGHGKASVSAETATVGDRIEIVADPDDGYRVKKVIVVDAKGNSIPVSFVSEDKDYTEIWSFTMPAEDVEITVKFEVQGSSYYFDVRTDAWYYEAVTFVTDRGYFCGVTDTLFAPYMNMSREMFVTVIGRIAEVDAAAYAEKTSKFTDVEADEWYTPYIIWAEETGVVKGISDTSFGVGEDITREQMFTMLYRYAQSCGMDVTPKNEDFLDRYTDRDEISEYAVEALNWCVGEGIARGMSSTTIDPLSLATRAQAAQMFKNFCDKVLYQ
ncbi:MAG: InlB B-repeat-containing protein [Faecousia sp.]